MRDWAGRLRHHSHAWLSSLVLHAVIFLWILWWGTLPLIPGQGAVEVWLVGGLPGGGGASGLEAGYPSTSRSEEGPKVESESIVRAREGSHFSGESVRPQVGMHILPHAPEPKDVTKPQQRVAPEAEPLDTATEETTPAAASPSSVVVSPRPAEMELQRPPSPVTSLLAKALPAAVPRMPFQGVTIPQGKSSVVSREAEGPSQVGVGSEDDAEGPDRTEGEEDFPQGSERRQRAAEGGGGSGSDGGRGGGQGVRGTGDGSWIGGEGGAGKGGGGDWRVLLLERIEGAKRYPAQALRLGIEGIAEVQFRITRDGTVEGVTVVKSSGFSLLDHASVETIKRAAPFPPIPGIIRVPISYRLRDVR